MIPGLDPDPESNFQVFAIPDWDRVKSGNVTLMLSCYDSGLGSGSILLAVPQSDFRSD